MSTLFIFVATFLFLLLIIFGIGFTKGFYHMAYLKKVFPKKYNRYKNFWSVFGITNYSTICNF